MVKRMLIDSTHAEETRVVVVNGTRLEEFDVETSTKKQLKGNIYLAKIVRVEPSLQAAFVDYGGNRHGFLAFSEIHPDYFQIPVADRQALMAEHREVMKQSATATSADFGDGDEDGGAKATEVPSEPDHGAQPAEAGEAVEAPAEAAPVETVGGDETEEVERRRPKSLRSYKIQEVIKRRQIVLIQVVKEERGNKGAALTTYLSLAGRYCVLMPNTARGGGVSRKITNTADRKRLKAIANEMDIPDGMAVIVRTAGSERTKPEIRRDYEYLLRLWDSVRELTLRSTAPALVYEEANLIKRSIRDLYSRDIDEVLVDGEEGYRLAKDYMRMLTPSHARKVQLYKDPAMPLLHRFQVETQLDAMHSPVVQLKSGGYIVMNQTEALVAIDVNSGRSTKERHIEETALKTNLEAADEIARQLRLRDLAGLIVIDFIDMEESRNNAAVERRLKEAMRSDRSRIQLGKISAFGLLELSRQRLRPSLMETSFQPCTHCGGTGVVRSVESASVRMLRVIEEEGIQRRSSEITVTAHPSIALYILNQKRLALTEIEARYGLRVNMWGDDSLIPPAYRMERVKAETAIEIAPAKPIVAFQTEIEPEPAEVEEVVQEEDEERVAEAKVAAAPVAAEAAGDDGEGGRRRRRRRRRRGRRDGVGPAGEGMAETEAAESAPVEAVEPTEAAQPTEPAEPLEAGETREGGDAEPAIELADALPRRRRRGKRGGRRRNRQGEAMTAGENGDEPAEGSEAEPAAAIELSAETQPAALGEVPAVPVAAAVEPAAPDVPGAPAAEAPAEAAPAKPKRTRSRKKPEAKAAEPEAQAPAESAAPVAADAAAEAPAAKPKRTRSRKKPEIKAAEPEAPVEAAQPETAAPEAEQAEAATAPQPAEPEARTPEPAEASSAPAGEPSEQPSAPRRRGWWNRPA